MTFVKYAYEVALINNCKHTLICEFGPIIKFYFKNKLLYEYMKIHE